MRSLYFSPVMSMPLQVFAASPILWLSVSDCPFQSHSIVVCSILSPCSWSSNLFSLAALFVFVNHVSTLFVHPAVTIWQWICGFLPLALSVCSFETRLLKYVHILTHSLP